MNDKIISHYRITGKISEGGMGVVYKAEDLRLNRTVAIKFLPANVTAGLDQKNRFLIEAKALATLNHPNIATIFEIEESGDELFIVMEYVDGSDLRRIMADYHTADGGYEMPLEIILKMAEQIIRGLKTAHQKQIIHRDIKPENIMINTGGYVKILDFGLAKMAGSEQLTKTGTTMGTVAYMSPEQAGGKGTDHRTDIWSFGVVLYEMITGCRPFKGDYEQAVIYSILNEDPAPLEEYRRDLPENLKKLVNKSLSKNPDDRYADCEALLKDMQSCTPSPVQDFKMDVHKTIPPLKKHRKLRQYFKWVIIPLIIILFAAGIYIFGPELHSSRSYGKKIAVLPFLNLSNNVNDEYFSDGIMDDILTQLVKISDLKVISRTTMMRYKNSDKDLKEISKEVNADVVLEGSIRHYANQLRITVQLIDAKTDEHIWAESYDRSIKDIFDVQSQVASQIAGTLQAELSSGEKEGLTRLTTKNPEAYNAYLQGRYFLQLHTREDLEKATVYFKQAIQFDPLYAQPWAGLSQVHSTQADMGILPIEEGYKLAKAEAEQTLKLDPKLAEAYARLAWINMTYDWNWNSADKNYKLALQLEPGNAAIIQSSGVLASVFGRLNEAIELSKQAIELNPLLSTPRYNLGLYYYYAHQWREAEAAVRKALELNPQYPDAHVLLGRIYLGASKPKEALVEMNLETEIPWRKFGLVLAYHTLGMKKEEEKTLTEFIKEYQYDSAYQIAEIYAFRGDSNAAFKWLEVAYKQRDGGLGDMKRDPLMDNIVKDQRYAVFMEKLGL